MDPRFALLLSCFFLSGFAALLYQTAWTRELSFVFGTSELAVAVVLAAYMGGLALGAAAAGRFAMQLRRPVLAYGLLELAIAVCALLVPFEIRGINALYVALLGGGDTPPESSMTVLFQLTGTFAILLPPTAFMGATLPLLARHSVHREEEIASRIGTLYALNTAGAIAGTIGAAFVLMPALGLRHTVWVGIALNAVVFGLAGILARGAPHVPAPRPSATRGGAALWILPCIAFSGSVSFVYEVLWTRLLGHLLGASVHAFATMLASFLLGIALGSAVAARIATSRSRAILGFSLSQLGIAIGSYGAFALADFLPDFATHLGAGPDAPLANTVVAISVLLPATLCIGATFPFSVRVLARSSEEAAASSARAFASNTLGAIAGALGAGLFLLPIIGFHGSLTLGVATNLGLAIVSTLAEPPRRLLPVGVALALALVLILVPAHPPWNLLEWGPRRAGFASEVPIYTAVGRSTTVALHQVDTEFRLTTDGLPEARIDRKGMRPEINVAHWLGILPALVRPEARDVLVVGLGGGVALELAPSSYQRIDVIELEQEVLEANRRIAHLRARDPLSDPRVRILIGDARGMLQLADRRFDAIVSQPSHPWTAGASHLYTREFFSLVRSRLSSDGVFVQWIGIRYVDEPLIGALLAALLEVFPHVEVFRPEVYGMLFVASQAPIDLLAGAAQALNDAPADLARLGLQRIEDVATAWALDVEGARILATGASPNTDDYNHLATRSARLGDERLDAAAARRLLDPHDPLNSTEGLDRNALVRGLLDRGQAERAADLAMTGDETQEELGLGWVELRAGRAARASRHFERALTLAPENPDARAGWIASHEQELRRGQPFGAALGEALDPRYAAVIEGWRRAARRDWTGVAELDESLAQIEPGEALFDAAARLRIRACLSQTDSGMLAIGTLQLAEELLLRTSQPGDALLHARAAIRAGDPLAAWGSLFRTASRTRPTQEGRKFAERLLSIARELPEDDYRSIQAEVKRRTLGSAASSGSVTLSTAPEGTPR